MALPLTFGVEFEFVLAYLSKDSTLPHPDDAKKIIHITPTEEDWKKDLWGSPETNSVRERPNLLRRGPSGTHSGKQASLCPTKRRPSTNVTSQSGKS